MKFGTAAAVVYGAIFAFATFETAFAADEQQNRKGDLLGYFKDKFAASNKNKDLDEDEVYWNRLMQETVGSLPPPTPPVSAYRVSLCRSRRTILTQFHFLFCTIYSLRCHLHLRQLRRLHLDLLLVPHRHLRHQ
jgi:hypothetical protein